MKPATTTLAELERARDAVRVQDYDTARDALVNAWRVRRSPVLAGLVELFDDRAPDALTAQLAAVITPRVITSHAAFEQLASVDDPRLARFALDALVNLPFTSVTAKDFLSALVGTVERLADPRIVARADAIRAAVTTRVNRLAIRTSIVTRVDAMVAGLPPLPEPTAEERGLEEALVAQLEPLRSTVRSAESLLADIYANPDDDGPRLVYADLLLERGDPRGELITLQIERANRDINVATKRELELLKRHGKAWLGALVPALSWGRGYSGTEFRRGFVAVADIIGSIGKKLEPIRADPAWATVEALDGSYDNELLLAAPLRALRALDRELTSSMIARLAEREIPLGAVTSIRIADTNIAPAELRRAFPALRTVKMYRYTTGSNDLAALGRLGVDHIVITNNWVHVEHFDHARDEFTAYIASLVGSPAPIAHLSLSVPHKSHFDANRTIELRRGANGRFER